MLSKISKTMQGDASACTAYNFELFEALCRMRVDTMTDLIRQLMRDRKLSRKAKDICVQMLFFANLLSQHGQAGDKDVVRQLIGELKFLQVNELTAESINYLMQAFTEIATQSNATRAFHFTGEDEQQG